MSRYYATANPEGQGGDRIQIWLRHKIVTAVEAFVCFVKFRDIQDENTYANTSKDTDTATSTE